MSLISDALKTAQRERSQRTSAGATRQPLLEGFFPYVATEVPARRSRRKLFIAVALSSVVLLGVAAWLAAPAIRRSLAARSGEPALVPPAQAVRNPVTPPAQVSQAVADSSSVVTAAPEPTVRRNSPDTRERLPVRNPPRPATAPSSAVAVSIAAPASGDTVIARPGAEISQAPPPTPRVGAVVPVDYEARAIAFFNAGDIDRARENFLLATRHAPTARAWTNYGITLQTLGDLSAAGAAYQTAIGIDGNYLEAWLYQGRLAKLRGETQRSIPLFQRARAINPRHAAVNTELAELEVNAKNWTEGRRFAEEALRADPTNARAHYFLAASADQLGDVDTAIRGYTAYLQTIGAAEKENLASVGYSRMRLQQLRGRP